jgi:DNA-binding NtrC family response regulator
MALKGEWAQLASRGGGCEGTGMAQELMIETGPAIGGLKERVATYERRLIQEALWLAGGNQRRAAAALGCLPTTLNEKMRRLGLRDLLRHALHSDDGTLQDQSGSIWHTG